MKQSDSSNQALAGRARALNNLGADLVLCVAHLAILQQKLRGRVHDARQAIRRQVARLKPTAIGIGFDKLTQEQRQNLTSWQEGIS